MEYSGAGSLILHQVRTAIEGLEKSEQYCGNAVKCAELLTDCGAGDEVQKMFVCRGIMASEEQLKICNAVNIAIADGKKVTLDAIEAGWSVQLAGAFPSMWGGTVRQVLSLEIW